MSSEGVKNTVSLMVITLVAGLLLGLVYEITKEPIAREQQRAKEEAYKQVFAEAASFEALNVDSGRIERELKGHGMDATINEAMRVLNETGNAVGYVLTVTEHEGYGGDIQFAMGVTGDGTVNGISFLSIGETAGLGMKAKEDSFKNQFAGKKAESFVYTKNGAAADNEIDAISGATITTNAVTNGVNAGLYYIHTLEE
ncbi:MAG: RnfABCDGE type electron transport complex subunit G [Bacteroidales bacterium]|nr:RnfABCDGE type electron transport complex subunit G [Clostridium sp.]MCM1202706.1 RnfABCDGE type electron transport complex subunit G [Bacteroidales bacterium]